jgi:nucleotide-binding universal stress UspA family protein
MTSFDRFLVPFDFSDHSRAALALAADLARRVGAELQLLHIVVPIVLSVPAIGPTPVPVLGVAVDLPREAERSLAQLAAPLVESGLRVETHVIESSSIAEAIRRYAEKIGADLIVMGTHGRAALLRVLLGSVTERTAREAPCPVLLTSSVEAERESDGG